MQNYLYCPGPITADVNGVPACASGWVVVDSPSFTLAELSTTDLAALMGAALVVLALAYGFKVLRKTLGGF